MKLEKHAMKIKRALELHGLKSTGNLAKDQQLLLTVGIKKKWGKKKDEKSN